MFIVHKTVTCVGLDSGPSTAVKTLWSENQERKRVSSLTPKIIVLKSNSELCLWLFFYTFFLTVKVIHFRASAQSPSSACNPEAQMCFHLRPPFLPPRKHIEKESQSVDLLQPTCLRPPHSQSVMAALSPLGGALPPQQAASRLHFWVECSLSILCSV